MSRWNDMVYPVPAEQAPNNCPQYGLTVREHFAAQFLAALISNLGYHERTDGLAEVEAAIQYADALLAALAKAQP